MTEPSINADHLLRQRAFSRATFGPGRRVKGISDHIRKELIEVEEADAQDVAFVGRDFSRRRNALLGEWVDVIILAFDGPLRAGFVPTEIIRAIRAKQSKNEDREWPDWRTAPINKAIEHVRTGEPS